MQILRSDKRTFPTNIILIFVLFFVTTYQSRTTWGFWFPGIRGWDYSEYSTSWRLEKNKTSEPESEFPKFLLISEPRKLKISHNSLINGKGIFLHFNNNSVLPTNMGITKLVFPHYVLDRNNGNFDNNILDIVRHNLEKEQNHKKAFLLPKTIAYPSHTLFQKIDYSRYPSFVHLEGVYPFGTLQSKSYQIVILK